MKHLKALLAGLVLRLALFGLFYLVSSFMVQDAAQQFALVTTLAATEMYLIGRGVLAK